MMRAIVLMRLQIVHRVGSCCIRMRTSWQDLGLMRQRYRQLEEHRWLLGTREQRLVQVLVRLQGNSSEA